MTEITTFEVRKDDLSQTRLTTRRAEIGDGAALLRIERFAFTANNVTYGVVGERIGYWKFFPTDEEGWGVIPVWGIAEVIEESGSGLPVGERLYGYWPMASHAVIEPARVDAARLFDGAAHRAELPPVYNRYARLAADPDYDRAMDDERMTLFPLYATSFCLYDFLKDNGWFGASRVILPSASSKTAIGTAYALKTEAALAEGAPRLVGVTSERNRAAVERLGLYDDVLTYDEIEARIETDQPSVIVDMSGSGDVVGRLHKRLGENMRHTSNVGLTHIDDFAGGMGPDYIRDRSAMFFAPGHIQKRGKEWGKGVFDAKAAAFWREAAVKSRTWLTIERRAGAEAVTAAYADVLAGKTPADRAWVVGFQ